MIEEFEILRVEAIFAQIDELRREKIDNTSIWTKRVLFEIEYFVQKSNNYTHIAAEVIIWNEATKEPTPKPINASVIISSHSVSLKLHSAT